jgi:hypothetical protein
MSERTDLFIIPLPGGRVAKVPLAVLEQYVDPGAVSQHAGGDDSDVSAHHVIAEHQTGASVWHTEWELGPCDFTDDSGFPQSTHAWHRHPLGTEYTEVYHK